MKDQFLKGKKISTKKLKKNVKVTKLVDNYFQSYNSARLNESCRLLTERMLDPEKDTTIGLTLAGALTPAGMSGMIVSMMEKGFIDFIISTGANLYHDIHFALGYHLRKGDWQIPDDVLWDHGIVRIYDTFLSNKVLHFTDKYLRDIFLDKKQVPRGLISSSELHHYIGRRLLKESSYPSVSILAQAAKLNIPIYTSSPADSTLGMDLACYNKYIYPKDGINLKIDPSRDLLETTAIVFGAKKNGAIILGGGSPKNFYMQTQPMLWEVLNIQKGGHDYFIQITMDSPQWGGLSGATPQEAISWGKINHNEIKNTVVVYSDVTIAAPILFSYAIERARRRKQKELYLKKSDLLKKLVERARKTPINWLEEYKR